MRNRRVVQSVSTALRASEVKRIDKYTKANKENKDDYRPRNRAEFIRAAVRFATDNPRTFDEWLVKKWDGYADLEWDAFIEEINNG